MTGKVILQTGKEWLILGARPLRPHFFYMEDNHNNNQENKTPSKMARLAWPKAKYGVIVAILIIVIVNLLYYKDIIVSFFN